MVKIRLRRVGAKKQASYRVVVTDSRAPRDGRFIEAVGFYNPRTEPETIEIKEDRVLYWLNVGAQPTDAVARLLQQKGTMARFERLRQGESLEALAAEAEEEAKAAPKISPKTRRDDLAPVAKKPSKPEAAESGPEEEPSEAEEAEEIEEGAAEPETKEESKESEVEREEEEEEG
jgi:small subunit ribosomal protein S16